MILFVIGACIGLIVGWAVGAITIYSELRKFVERDPRKLRDL